VGSEIGEGRRGGGRREKHSAKYREEVPGKERLYANCGQPRKRLGEKTIEKETEDGGGGNLPEKSQKRRGEGNAGMVESEN